MKRVGLVLHHGRSEAAAVASRLTTLLGARRVEVHVLTADAARIADTSIVVDDVLPDDLDLVFVLGGDGTLLRAAETVGRSGVPLLGVNIGHLGFLSELERADLEAGITRILDRGFTVEERMVLQGEILEGGAARAIWAMNDVIIEKVEIGRSVKLGVCIDGEPFVSWPTDGIIVATATGSTAYSFSAGGPVVSPRIDCILVTPVAPHGLFDRTVIVPPEESVLITVLPDGDAASLSADGGRALPLSSGAEVLLRAGETRVRLAKLEPAPFWRLVRDKFHLRPERG